MSALWRTPHNAARPDMVDTIGRGGYARCNDQQNGAIRRPAFGMATATGAQW